MDELSKVEGEEAHTMKAAIAAAMLSPLFGSPGHSPVIIRQVQAWQTSQSPPLRLLGLHACKTSCRLAANQTRFVPDQLRGYYAPRLWLTLGLNFVQTPSIPTRQIATRCLEHGALDQVRGWSTE